MSQVVMALSDAKLPEKVKRIRSTKGKKSNMMIRR